MSEKFNKWNLWLHRNLFWVVLCFAFLISVLVVMVGYGVWTGIQQRKAIQDSTEAISLDQKQALQEALELQKMINKK